MINKPAVKDVKVRRHFKLFNTLLFLLFPFGIGLAVWEIDIYRNTFIPFAIPLLIWFLTGIVVTPRLRKFMDTYFGESVLFQALYNIVSFGSIVVWLFMWLNYHFTVGETTMVNEKIISTGTLAKGEFGSCEQPYAIINYKGNTKQIIFYCGQQVELYKSVQMIIRRGLFGFDVTLKSDLKE
jgi:hypothetical protein